MPMALIDEQKLKFPLNLHLKWQHTNLFRFNRCSVVFIKVNRWVHQVDTIFRWCQKQDSSALKVVSSTFFNDVIRRWLHTLVRKPLLLWKNIHYVKIWNFKKINLPIEQYLWCDCELCPNVNLKTFLSHIWLFFWRIRNFLTDVVHQ